MTYRVHAVLPDDGWVYLSHQGAFYRLRPPYKLSSLMPLSESIVHTILVRGGASPILALQKAFVSFEELVDALHKATIQRLAHALAAEKETLAIEDVATRLARVTDAHDREAILVGVGEKDAVHGAKLRAAVAHAQPQIEAAAGAQAHTSTRDQPDAAVFVTPERHRPRESTGILQQLGYLGE